MLEQHSGQSNRLIGVDNVVYIQATPAGVNGTGKLYLGCVTATSLYHQSTVYT